MANQWFKFYGNDFLADPKISALTAQERSCWVTLLCLANSSSDPGTIEFLTTEVLLAKSGIIWDPYHPEEWDRCLSVLQKLEKMKMIKASVEGVIKIINWEKRQESFLTDAERARIYREKKKMSHENVTERPTNVTIDKNRIEKNRIDIDSGEPSKKENILPDWLDKKIWAEWVDFRKKDKKTLSEVSIKKQIKFLEENKSDHVAILNQSMMNGYTGLFPVKKGGKNTPSNIGPKAPEGKYDNIVVRKSS